MIFYRYEDYHGACGSLYLGHSLEGSGLDLGSISLLLYEVINLVYSETYLLSWFAIRAKREQKEKTVKPTSYSYPCQNWPLFLGTYGTQIPAN